MTRSGLIPVLFVRSRQFPRRRRRYDHACRRAVGDWCMKDLRSGVIAFPKDRAIMGVEDDSHGYFLMKLTILHVGEVTEVLRDRYERFTPFFETMFGDLDMGFTFEAIPIIDGAPFPDLDTVEAVVIPGSAAGVYDQPDWIEPLRDFIRRAYDGEKADARRVLWPPDHRRRAWRRRAQVRKGLGHRGATSIRLPRGTPRSRGLVTQSPLPPATRIR